MISAPGVGSGLDVSSIVDQLMSIERAPLRRMESDKKDLETQLSAFGKLKSALSTFQTAFDSLKTLDSFEIYKADSSNEGAFTATADSTAAVGFNSIQVVSLAEAHKMGSVAIADTDTTTLGGAGDQMTFTINANAFTVDVGGLTLSGIRDAINDATDNTGVSASIISENSGSNRLVLTATATGNANSINISSTGTVGTDLGLTDINDPLQLDSEILVDGLYTIIRSSNTIDDAISGVTISLLSETTAADQLTITRDVESVQASVQEFIDAFNALNTVFGDLSGEGNDLEADNTIRSIENQVRSVFNTPPTGLTGSFTYLSEAGVSFQRDGTLSLDATGLETAIGSDFTGLAEMFANNDQGYLFRLDSLIANFVQTDGLINAREDGINSRIDTTKQRILDLEFRLELREQRLLTQFTNLDVLMGQLNGTSAFLSQQLANLPKLTLNG
ncbi:Flagellar cap protein FliD [hydrothermal vent metagenome]|uniref:Filament cap protein n=1 Tax=hydrothermal vent metagenome TaxID=652676 RepID=A0A3B0YL83_9ZZZZ